MSWDISLLASMGGQVATLADYFVMGLIAFRVWVVLRVAKDISLRTESFLYQLIAILIALIPVAGFLIYLLIRPPYLLKDTGYWQDAIELQTIVCPSCGWLNSRELDKCWWCWESIKVECKECKNLIWKDLEYCIWCGAPVIEEGGKSEAK